MVSRMTPKTDATMPIPAASSSSKNLKWVFLFSGLLLVLGSLVGLAYHGHAAWVAWHQALPHPAPLPKAPPPPKFSFNLALKFATWLVTSKFVPWLVGEIIALFLGIWLLQFPGRKSAEAAAEQVAGTDLAVAPHKVVKQTHAKRWQSCNILQASAGSRRIWNFSAGKGGFTLTQQQSIPDADPLPIKMVGRDWKTLIQPKLNIAWLPIEQVFLRVAQLPASNYEETLSMVELQLEKLSPLPVTQIVWSIEILPNQVDNLQTVIVMMVARDLVERFLGELEKQGFLADRLEFPILDQLLNTTIREDGAYLYPDSTTGKFTALVAWWQGGVLRNLSLAHLPATENRAAILQEQLAQIAWSGEMEGWLKTSPRWHLVADEITAANWQPMFQPWLGKSVAVIAPLAEPQLAVTNANRAGRAGLDTGILPPEYLLRYAQEFHDRLWMRGVFALLAVYVFGVIIYMAGASWAGMGADQLEAEKGGLAREYTNTMQLKAQLEILQNRQALKFASLDCWKITAELLPDSVTVQTLEFKDGKHFSLSGVATADKREQVTDFNEALRKALLGGEPMFEELKAPEMRLAPGGATLSWSFDGSLARAEEQK